MSSLNKQDSPPETGGSRGATTDGHLQISNLTKRFGDITACKDINIDIGSDEFIVFLGPSGCGKTTTLRCIAGLESPNEGTIQVGNEDITAREPKDRNLAFVFQSIALFPHMSVKRNIRFGLDMQTDLEGEEKAERVEEAAELLGIADKLDRKPSALSGGQQQRVSLGRAMVMEPEAFLLDEPFSALDAKLRDQLRVEIQKLQQRLGLAMIFVTHDQEEAMMLGDRIVVMNDGQIEQIGTPDEIYNDPVSHFVADFIGSPATNFIESTVESTGDGAKLETELFSVSLSDDLASAVGSDQSRATIGIRPHELELATAGEQSHFTAEVTVVEPHGDRDAVYLDAEGWDPTLLTESGRCTEGETVDIRLNLDGLWLFGPDGERIS